jgi:hypothetical protein
MPQDTIKDIMPLLLALVQVMDAAADKVTWLLLLDVVQVIVIKVMVLLL